MSPRSFLGVLSLCTAIGLAGLLLAADPNAIKHQGPDTLGNPLGVAVNPPGANGTFQTALTASSQTTTGNTAINATLAGTSGKTTYLTGFYVTGSGATSASIITVTISNTVSGSLLYQLVIPAGVTTSLTPLNVQFSYPIPANATNISIQVAVPAFGSGNTNASVVAPGFQM
jgi:hypothetical protein